MCRELGIGIVGYSPLGRGFFGGKGMVESLPSQSLLVRQKFMIFMKIGVKNLLTLDDVVVVVVVVVLLGVAPEVYG